MTKKFITVGMAGILAWATAASAAMIEDFEPGTSYAGFGTLQADPLDAGNQVLNLAAWDIATFAPSAAAGTVTMKIYDFGGVPTFNGARWGVADADQSTAVAIIDKTWLDANTGYGMGQELSQNGDWWSPAYFGGPRQTAQWTTWTFDVATDGAVTIEAFLVGAGAPDMSQAYGTVDAMDSIWISGGKFGQSLGVLVDDITFEAIPEPATLSLVGIFAGAMLFIRRRSRN